MGAWLTHPEPEEHTPSLQSWDSSIPLHIAKLVTSTSSTSVESTCPSIPSVPHPFLHPCSSSVLPLEPSILHPQRTLKAKGTHGGCVCMSVSTWAQNRLRAQGPTVTVLQPGPVAPRGVPRGLPLTAPLSLREVESPLLFMGSRWGGGCSSLFNTSPPLLRPHAQP